MRMPLVFSDRGYGIGRGRGADRHVLRHPHVRYVSVR